MFYVIDALDGDKKCMGALKKKVEHKSTVHFYDCLKLEIRTIFSFHF